MVTWDEGTQYNILLLPIAYCHVKSNELQYNYYTLILYWVHKLFIMIAPIIIKYYINCNHRNKIQLKLPH